MPALVRDVCIVGGGPAGSVAARLLASWGRSVVIVHRRSTRPALAESIPPSTRKLLALVGAERAVNSARLFPNTGNSAWWGGRDHRAVCDVPGYHVARDRWDKILLACARDAGAEVVDATVHRVDPVRPRVEAVDGTGTAFTVDCRYVLDCSGRTGVVARLGLRRRPAAYRTLAIAATWETPSWPVHERTHTIVESYDEGWCWSVPLSNDARQCTVMIDPAPLAPGRGGRRRDGLPWSVLYAAYARELQKTTAVGERLRGARQVTPPFACDASLYDCDRAADGRAILVGDAASFIEPLSSAGVKKAMLSAWRAAIVANTCLKSDAARSFAFDYHTAREREVFRRSARQAGVFFAEAAAAHTTAFWDTRAALADTGAPDDAGDAISDETLAGADVLAAFDTLRSNTSARLSVSPDVAREPSPAIEGDEIVLRDALRLPGFPHPVRFASNVDLPALVDVVERHADIGSALAAYRRDVNGVAPSDVLRGLSLLVAQRAILQEGVRS